MKGIDAKEALEILNITENVPMLELFRRTTEIREKKFGKRIET